MFEKIILYFLGQDTMKRTSRDSAEIVKKKRWSRVFYIGPNSFNGGDKTQ